MTLNAWERVLRPFLKIFSPLSSNHWFLADCWLIYSLQTATRDKRDDFCPLVQVVESFPMAQWGLLNVCREPPKHSCHRESAIWKVWRVSCSFAVCLWEVAWIWLCRGPSKVTNTRLGEKTPSVTGRCRPPDAAVLGSQGHLFLLCLQVNALSWKEWGARAKRKVCCAISRGFLWMSVNLIYSRVIYWISSPSRVGSAVKKPPNNAGHARNMGSIPGSGRPPGEGNGNPLQSSCLENPMNRGAWRATVCGVTQSQTQLSD